MVVLVAQEKGIDARVPDSLERAHGIWTACFDGLPAGSYVIAVAPIDK
jgi:hypothetical protein